MLILIAATFLLAYAAIALEHPLKINKSATALIAAGLMWTLFSFAPPPGPHGVGELLGEKLQETAAIIFFLIGAMTIVEVIDAHGGFEVITRRIKAKRLRSLLWVIGVVTFLLSAVLDNLTTTIVMIALVRKLLKNHEDRLFFAGIIVIAANAGGAWSPIGDVTTTMLWIGGQITTLSIMKSLLVPSLVSLAIPLLATSFFLKGKVVPPAPEKGAKGPMTSPFEKKFIFFLGIGSLVFVPVFKTVTHLPPWLGILLALGILWLASELMHRHKHEDDKAHLTLGRALRRIDMSSVTFFIGILLAVATLSATGQLPAMARWLDNAIGNQTLIVLVIGLVSAVVDNIPLVAASMGMYPLSTYPADHFIWEFLAYCAGTGGSILVIGSAAGVAAMGLEKIHFFWYVKRVSLLALLGYFAGAGAYVLQYRLLHH
ncbi:MAG: sodium:proton antiporter NhaD [Spirochaetes bacterium]|nr:sodium:proton antiporter NhaD [Spirochaetota bacterium]